MSELERDHFSKEQVNVSMESVPITGKSNMSLPVLSSVPSFTPVEALPDDSSSDEENPSDEARHLRQHQTSLSRRSYASAAANVNDIILKVSFPNASLGFGRPRPRTVLIGGPINPRILVAKLNQHHIRPKQIQVLMSGDIAVTIQSVADKQSFLNLDFVSTSDSSFSHAVWVRVHFKPAELKMEVVYNRLQEFGTTLFHRENRILGTDSLSGSLTFKMR